MIFVVMKKIWKNKNYMADLDKFWYQVFFQVFLEFFSTLGNVGTFRVEMLGFFVPKITNFIFYSER